MVQDLASLYAQEEARLRHNSPEVNDVLSKIHQDSPTTNTWKTVRWRTLLQTCEFFNDVCCPGSCEDWMASQSPETQFFEDFHPLGKS